MNLNFEVENGNPFSLEVGLFDTVQEIKEKIDQYRGIPACNQTLIFDGQILEGEYAINNYDIVTGSCVKLIMGVPPRRIGLHIRSPRARVGYPVEVSVDDTVKHLKVVVSSMESVDPNQLAILPSGSNVELQDHHLIGECGLELQPNIDVLVKPMPRRASLPRPPPSLHIPSSSRNIIVRVLPWEGTQKVTLEVDPSENVVSLRNELEDMQPDLGNGLPPEGYFFIHNQSYMEEDQTFMWHGVKHGDTIEVFKGHITTNDSAPPERNPAPQYRSF